MSRLSYILTLACSWSLLPVASVAQDMDVENGAGSVVAIEPVPRAPMSIPPAASSRLNLRMSCELRTASDEALAAVASFRSGLSHGDPIPVSLRVEGESAFTGEGFAGFRAHLDGARVLEFVAHREEVTLKLSFANVRTNEAALLTIMATRDFSAEEPVDWRPYAVGFCATESITTRTSAQ